MLLADGAPASGLTERLYKLPPYAVTVAIETRDAPRIVMCPPMGIWKSGSKVCRIDDMQWVVFVAFLGADNRLPHPRRNVFE